MLRNFKIVTAAAVLALLSVAGCDLLDSSGSPTGASPLSFGAASSGATIVGSVSGMGSAERSVAGGPPSGLKVTVVGTALAAQVSVSGRFQLVGVPAGDVLLQFTDANVNATALLPSVGDGDQIDIEIAVNGTTAAIVSEARSAAKVQLCHRTGTGQFHLIDVSVNAESAHRAHGDGEVGDPVPGDPTRRFGADCVPAIVAVIIQKATNGQDADRAPGPSIPVGDPVTWTYAVTNTGVVDLINIVVTDDHGVIVNCGGQTTLAVGQSMTCTGLGVAAVGPYMNIGTVTALADSATVTDSDPSHYVGVEPVSTPKVRLCHRTGNGSFHLIEVSISAEPAHRGHGDGRVSEAVPGQLGSVFSPTCGVSAALAGG